METLRDELRHAGYYAEVPADALGYTMLSQDDERAQEFARPCLQAVGSMQVTVDLPGLAVTY